MSDFRNLLDQQDRFRQLVDDIHTRNETFSKLVERSPGMKALQDSIDRFAELSAPMHKSAMAIQDSIRRFAAVTEPMHKSAMAIQESIRRFADVTEPMHQQLANMSRVSDAIRESTSVRGAFVPTRIEPEIFEPPLWYVEERPQRPGPAQEVLQIIMERFDAEKAENKDRRHDVFIIVTLMDGTHLYVDQLTSEGEHLIRVEGKDAELNSHSVTVGADAIQFEFVTVKVPPKKPDLRPVK